MVALAVKKSKSSSSKTMEKTMKQTQERVDKELLEKAVKALLKYHETSSTEGKDKEQLLGTDTSIQVQFTLEVAPVRPSKSPIRLDIPHPIYNVSPEETNDQLDEPDVCLIVKDEAKPWVKEMIAKFPEQMGFVKKVMGLESLRKKHAQFSQRRELLKKYAVFMADDRILPMLTKALGRDFLKAKKHPFPISLTRQSALPFVILKTLSSTFLHLNSGNCVTVRAGYTHMSTDALCANIVAIIEGAVPRIPRKWANIRAMAIKTPISTSLPFYNKTPAELAEIARLAGISQAWKKDEDMAKKDEEMTDKESPKKRKESTLKSPLLQALKKQKHGESEGKAKESESKPNEKVVEDAEEVPTKEKKQKKSRKNSDVSKQSTNDETKEMVVESKEAKVDQPTDTTTADEKPSSSLKKKKRKSEEGEKKTDDEKTPKKNKKVNKSEAAHDNDAKDKDDKKKEENDQSKSKTSKDFLPAQSFTQSKKGYVFRMGPKGLGYYVDVKPVPDKAALAALARMAAQQQQQRHQGQSSRKNDRRKSSGSSGKQSNNKGRKGRRSF